MGEPVRRREHPERITVMVQRVAGHDLHTASTSLDTFDGALCGFRDSGHGTGLASLALRCGWPNVRRADGRGDLVRVMSLRGAPHLHRRTDFSVLRAALATADPDDLEVMAGPLGPETRALEDPVGVIAAAMAAQMDALDPGEVLSKAELSTAVTRTVDPVVIMSCARCATDHAVDGLFRLATLRAGLELDPTTSTQSFTRPEQVDPTMPTQTRRDEARGLLARTGACLAVAIDQEQLAASIGWARASLVDALGDAAPAGRRTRSTRTIRLLPARDPWLCGSDRAWLLGANVDRRQDVFRSLGPPGVVLAEGEIVGTWRQRVTSGHLDVEIDAWRRYGATERDELTADAETVAATRDLQPKISYLT